MKKLRNIGVQLGKAFNLLVKNDPMRLAGATAFFTTFALPPIILLLIQLLSLVFNKRTISQQLLTELGGIVGKEGLQQVMDVLQGFKGLVSNLAIAIGGIFFLLFVATTLFKVIQSSLNQVWMIRKSGDKKFKMAMIVRLKSALVIFFTGIMFMITLLLESIKIIFGKYLNDVLPTGAFYLNSAFSTSISVVIVCVWFSILFRYFPDGRPTWRVALSGGLLTSLLFNFGSFLLKILLPGSNIGAIYGTSASIVLLLLFVFYSSLIFYYGAAFTKVWGAHINQPIKPLSHAALYESNNVEEGRAERIIGS